MRRTDAGKPRRHDLAKPREHDARGIHDTQPDTAQRAQVDPEQVLVAAWSPVTWNDGSLGCPQKDMLYTQALVDGELLMLRVEQALFQYHSARGGPFTYCAAPDASYTVTG